MALSQLITSTGVLTGPELPFCDHCPRKGFA